MSLTVTERPEKDLYVNRPPETYEDPYYTSYWNAGGGRLPIQYKLTSDKFPVNSVDDTDSICQVTDYNGYAKITLCGTYETYVNLEYIQISNCTNVDYNGVWQIVNKIGTVDLVINVAYSGTATGSFQRYYNNYSVKVKVYAGLPSTHPLQIEKPMSLIATLQLEPDSDNICNVSVGGLIKDKMNNNLCLDETVDLNSFTAFYISYAESYDVSDGTEVSSYTSSYTDDLYDDCAGELITNGDFSSGLSGWTQIKAGSTWASVSNTASVTRGANNASKWLQQSVELKQDIPYSLTLTYTNNESFSFRLVAVGFASDGSTKTIYDNLLTASASIDHQFTLPTDVANVNFYVRFSGSSSQVITIDSISIISDLCIANLWASNSTRQFKSRYGGNMGEYVMNFNNEVYDNKFLTAFSVPRLFVNQNFDLYSIIPQSVFNESGDGKVYCEVVEYSSTDTQLAIQSITIDNSGDGIYRTKLSDLNFNSSTKYITAQLYRLPNTSITAGDSGTFDFTNDPSGTPPSDWDICCNDIGTLSYDTTTPYEGLGDLKFRINSSGVDDGGYTIFQLGQPIDVTPYKIYEYKAYVKLLNTTLNFADGSRIKLIVVNEFASTIDIIEESYLEITDSETPYTELKVLFRNDSSQTVSLFAALFIDAPVSGGVNLEAYFDSITFKGPKDVLSELKTINIDRNCFRQSLQLTWRNEIGGWDPWTFTADKDYETTLEDAREYTKDIFANWDDTFINGNSSDEWLDIEAYWTVKVRSQYLNLDEVKAIAGDRTTQTAGIIGSIKVYDTTDLDNIVPVRVEKKNIKVRNDGDKLFSVEFEIRYPRIEIQNQ